MALTAVAPSTEIAAPFDDVWKAARDFLSGAWMQDGLTVTPKEGNAVAGDQPGCERVVAFAEGASAEKLESHSDATHTFTYSVTAEGITDYHVTVKFASANGGKAATLDISAAFNVADEAKAEETKTAIVARYTKIAATAKAIAEKNAPKDPFANKPEDQVWFVPESTEQEYACFRNFHPCKIVKEATGEDAEAEGYLPRTEFASSEHYFQAMKFAHSPKDFAEVAAAPTPQAAWEMGNDKARPLRPDWEAVKVKIMEQVLSAKFRQNLDIKPKLMGTGHKVIQYRNEKDGFWGDLADDVPGTGENQLGEALQRVRNDIEDDERHLACPANEVWFFKSKEVPYGVLANFTESKIHVAAEGDRKEATFASAEHYFQAMKFEHSPKDFADVAAAKNAKDAAKIGRDHTRPLRSDWDVVKDECMYKVCLAKFKQDRKLWDLLIGTGDKKIVERSPKDGYWGDNADGTGLNMLGVILMRVRERLVLADKETQDRRDLVAAAKARVVALKEKKQAVDDLLASKRTKEAIRAEMNGLKLWYRQAEEHLAERQAKKEDLSHRHEKVMGLTTRLQRLKNYSDRCTEWITKVQIPEVERQIVEHRLASARAVVDEIDRLGELRRIELQENSGMQQQVQQQYDMFRKTYVKQPVVVEKGFELVAIDTKKTGRAVAKPDAVKTAEESNFAVMNEQMLVELKDLQALAKKSSQERGMLLATLGCTKRALEGQVSDMETKLRMQQITTAGHLRKRNEMEKESCAVLEQMTFLMQSLKGMWTPPVRDMVIAQRETAARKKEATSRAASPQ